MKWNHTILVILALVAPKLVVADYNSAVEAGSIILEGDGDSDTLMISTSGGLLMHNRFDEGDSSFSSAFDWDTGTSGDQTVAAGVGTSFFIVGGPGVDTFQLGAPDVDLSALSSTGVFSVSSTDSNDTLFVHLPTTVGEVGCSANSILTPGPQVSRGGTFGGGVNVLANPVCSIKINGTSAGEPLFVSRTSFVVLLADGSNFPGAININMESNPQMFVDASGVSAGLNPLLFGNTLFGFGTPISLQSNINPCSPFVTLGSGNDSFTIDGDLQDFNLNISLGAGNDTFTNSAGASALSLLVFGDGGDDEFHVQAAPYPIDVSGDSDQDELFLAGGGDMWGVRPNRFMHDTLPYIGHQGIESTTFINMLVMRDEHNSLSDADQCGSAPCGTYSDPVVVAHGNILQSCMTLENYTSVPYATHFLVAAGQTLPDQETVVEPGQTLTLSSCRSFDQSGTVEVKWSALPQGGGPLEEVTLGLGVVYGAPPLPIYLLKSGNILDMFSLADLNAPISSRAITGLPAGQNMICIDARPANGELYGLSNLGFLFRINPTTAVATQVGASALAFVTDLDIGFDFDPRTDRIRLVKADRSNYRINPDTGLMVAQDTSVAYEDGDPHFGGSPSLNGLAHTNPLPGAASTTCFAIDINEDNLAVFGGISPNQGTLQTTTDFDAGGTDALGFDISIEGCAVVLQTFDLSTNPISFVQLIRPTLSVEILDSFFEPYLDVAFPRPQLPTATATDMAFSEPTTLGTALVLVPVELDQPVPFEVSINYTLVAGTAVTPQDFAGTLSGTCTFPAGTTEANIPVTLVMDELFEPDEQFSIQFSGAYGLIQGTNSINITIINDDPLPTLTAADVTIGELDSNTQVMVTFTLSAVSGGDAAFNYDTVSGSAGMVSDFESANDTGIIPAGLTSIDVPITIVGDNTPESTETFTVIFSAVNFVQVLDGSMTVTITDDDVASPTPTASPTASATPTASASPTASPTSSPTASPTPTASPSPTASASPTASPSPSPQPGDGIVRAILGLDPVAAGDDQNGDGEVDVADVVEG